VRHVKRRRSREEEEQEDARAGEARIDLFIGLYDGEARESGPVAVVHVRVRFLNPACRDEDPAARRFAIIEIE
jgi:hypothetical protein